MKRICLIIVFALSAAVCFAQERIDNHKISIMGLYGWNETWRDFGGLDIKGYIPVNNHFEATAALEIHNPQTYALTAVARPKFKLPVGEIFVDGAVHYRAHCSYELSDFNLAASMGYRMDYLSAQIGATSHFTFNLNRKESINSETITEPLNLLYRVLVNARPTSSRWNLGAGIANFNDFEYERTWSPMYIFEGRFDIKDNISILCKTDLKPAGIFHQVAEFWSIAVRAGVTYTF